MDDLLEFEKVTHRETLYKGVYLTLEKLDIELPNGNKGVREIVKVRNAVAIMPVDENQHVLMVRQSRPAVGRTVLEIPAGLLDDNEAEEDACRRECEEETGYRPRKLHRLIQYAHAEGYSSGLITLYLATDLEHTGKTNFDHSEWVEPVWIPIDELVHMVKTNQITDSKSIIGVTMCEQYIRGGCVDEGLLFV
jgi:ADP-ribose pyrophosphatase